MFIKSIIAVLSFTALLAEAGVAHNPLRAHGGVHKRRPHQLVRRSSDAPTKRCKVKSSPTTSVHKPTSTKSAAPTTTSSGGNSGGSGGSGGHGLISVTSPQCGASGATTKITTTSGPNGQEKWLNCGVDGGGWNPPHVTPDDVIFVELADALKMSNSPFKACSPYLKFFQASGDKYNLPDIFLASIALQESSCNPKANAGTLGLMQITTDKCEGRSESACEDPEFNIDAGAKYLSNTLAANGNNLVLALGTYNGWYKGMTVGDATKAAKQGHCAWQQNLDYIMQTLNGWMQGEDAYALGLGSYKNVNNCT
jgi:hypothetical protein